MKKPTIRISTIALSIFCLIPCLSACDVLGDPYETNPIVDSQDKETPQASESEDTTTDNSLSGITDVSISNQVLIEHEGIKITATEYKHDSIWGDGINLLIENNSAVDVGIGCDELIVNNYMISNLFSETVAAGKKSNKVLHFSEDELAQAGITAVGQIEAYFHFFDPASYRTTYTCDPVTVKTSAFHLMTTQKQDSGTELVNQNGIRIVGKYVDENDILGASVVLFIENNTGEDVIIQSDDLSANGFMITAMFSCTVYNGKMAVDDITLLSSSLEENGITSIDNIELKFKVLDASSYKTIFETDSVRFSPLSNG